MSKENTATNVYDFTYYKLMSILDSPEIANDEKELLMQLVDGYLEGSVCVVWVSGEPRFYDSGDAETESTTIKDILESEDELREDYLEGALDPYLEAVEDACAAREEAGDD